MITLQFSKVKVYSDKMLLDKVQSLPSFQGFPNDYWILGVQSNEDTFNEFDDKFYIFKGIEHIMTLSGTTNAGSTGLKYYDNYSAEGCAVIKTNEWYYDLWRQGLHKGKMPALKQSSPIKYYRDWNKNEKVEEIGQMYQGIIGINFHTVLYSRQPDFWRKYINGWSTGCQVVNHVGDYYKILDKIKNNGQEKVTYCLIKEF